MAIDTNDHSEKGYLMRLPVATVKGLLGSLLQFEQTNALTEFEEHQKQLYMEVLQQQGESTDVNIDGTPYFPYIRNIPGSHLMD